MELEEMKAFLKEKIDRVSDEDALSLLGNLLDNNDEKIFVLTAEQKEKIMLSLEQIKRNEVKSNKDVFNDTKRWLK